MPTRLHHRRRRQPGARHRCHGRDRRTPPEPDVEPERPADPEVEELQERLADLDTQILIDRAIRVQPRLAGADVWVTVKGSLVDLTGSVVSADQVHAAKEIAEATLDDAVVITSFTGLRSGRDVRPGEGFHGSHAARRV